MPIRTALGKDADKYIPICLANRVEDEAMKKKTTKRGKTEQREIETLDAEIARLEKQLKEKAARQKQLSLQIRRQFIFGSH